MYVYEVPIKWEIYHCKARDKTRASCVTLNGGHKNAERRTRNSVRQLAEAHLFVPVYIGYISSLCWCAFFSLFFSFFPQFSIIALCPHHMSFTSNYRKLRVSPNARELKYAPRVHSFSLSLSFRSDGVSQKEQRKQNGDGQRTGLLKRARTLNVSEYDSGLGSVKKPKK